jgi:hypothetical protein
MAYEHSIRRYRHWYAKLLRLYPKPYYERFGEGMEQTFNDLCRERRDAKGGLFGFVLWMFVETSAGITKENLREGSVMSWIFGIAVFATGVLNVFLVHPVPGVIYLLLSFVYFPPANAVLKKRFGFSIHYLVKIVLGLVIFFFTLGVSDLGDMID